MRPFFNFLSLELSVFLRARTAVFWTLAFPLLTLVVQMAFFGRGPAVGSLKVAIVDLDGSPASAGYADYVEHTLAGQPGVKGGTVRLTERPPSRIHYDLTVVLPIGFGKSVAAEEPGTVEIEPGAGSPSATMAAGLIRGLTDGYNLREANVRRTAQLKFIAGPSEKNRFSYSFYLVTGLSVMVILSTSLMGFASPLVSAREAGLFRIYQVFPIRPTTALGAWCAARLVIVISSVVLLFVVAAVFYQMPWSASPLDLALGGIALVFGTSSLLCCGLVIAALAPNVPAVTMICNLAYFPLLFTGNLLLPTSSLPAFLRRAMEFLPVNALVASLRRCLSGQAEIGLELVTFASLAVVAAGCLAIAQKHFTWAPRE